MSRLVEESLLREAENPRFVIVVCPVREINIRATAFKLLHQLEPEEVVVEVRGYLQDARTGKGYDLVRWTKATVVDTYVPGLDYGEGFYFNLRSGVSDYDKIYYRAAGVLGRDQEAVCFVRFSKADPNEGRPKGQQVNG